MARRMTTRDNYNEHRSLSEEAYDLIRQKILRGDYPLGTVLSRRKLAADFRMSFLPITEALVQLESDGLVESRPRVGTRVRIPSGEDIRGHYVIREGLESQAVRLFSEKASPDERHELCRMAMRVDALYDRAAKGKCSRESVFRVHDYHMKFHLRIAECAGCAALCHAIEKNQVLVFNWLYDMAADLLKLPPRFHLDLAKAVAGPDPEQADLAIRKHIRYGLNYILSRTEDHTVSGVWRLKHPDT
jgi:GntR family transcriptional regulator, rspAB operon transcriptional repressor